MPTPSTTPARRKRNPRITALLPCPFCGGIPEAYSEMSFAGTEPELVWRAGCSHKNNCAVRPVTSVWKTCEEAVARWNRRA